MTSQKIIKQKEDFRMKKITSLLLVIIMAISVFALTGCPNNPPQPPAPGLNDKSEGVMTWAEYDAAAMDAPVVIEAYVQGHQSWWDNKVTVYLQDLDGGYFAYELACSEEDAAKLTPGTKIRITGYKTAWAGEVEIVDATFEFVNDGLTYVAEPKDVTSLIASDELVKHQNTLVVFKGMTFVSLSYKGGQRGDDVYVTFSKDGATYDFCVERYLTDPSSDLYLAVEALKPGDVVDVEGFLYWYNGMNPHMTKITVNSNINAKSSGVMTWAEYDAAAIDAPVVIEAYVQGHQSWWDNKVTVYLQDLDGGYFAYELACSEEDAAKLTPGTKIRITGYKAAWAGEVEIVDATFEFVNDGQTYIAAPLDLTSIIGGDALINYQNMLVVFKGMTFKSLSYKGGERGDDIYVTFTKDGADYEFCVERYLTGPDSDVYKAVEALQPGQVVDVEGFLYWYNGMNPHITGIK